MVGEDAEKFRKLCEESGEFALKKFAEMTGLIQKLDDNTVAYVGDNGVIKCERWERDVCGHIRLII